MAFLSKHNFIVSFTPLLHDHLIPLGDLGTSTFILGGGRGGVEGGERGREGESGNS
jgi:hypothetical protein